MKKLHYAWIILIVCTLLFGFTAGTLLNCNGIFNTAICEDTGWKYSNYIVCNIYYGIGSLVALGFVSKVFQRVTMKWVIVIATALFSAAYAARAFMTSITAFSILNVFIGMTGAFIIYVPVPVIIKRWFVHYRGLALGISTMASGLGGAIASPIIVSWIEKYGWKTASLLNGGIALVVLTPIVILFLVDRPSDKGLKALGQEESLDESSIDAQIRTPKETRKKAVGIRRLLKLPSNEKNIMIKVAVCVLFALFAQLLATFYQQFTNMAIDLNYGLAFGGTLVSVALVFNMISKSVQGICMDKFGKKKTSIAFLIIVGIGFVILMLCGGNKILLYIGAACSGIASANSTMLPALLVDTFAKGEDYVKHFATVTYGTYLGAMFASYIPGYLREISGSYDLINGIYAFMVVISVIIVLWLLNGKEWAN